MAMVRISDYDTIMTLTGNGWGTIHSSSGQDRFRRVERRSGMRVRGLRAEPGFGSRTIVRPALMGLTLRGKKLKTLTPDARFPTLFPHIRAPHVFMQVFLTRVLLAMESDMSHMAVERTEGLQTIFELRNPSHHHIGRRAE